VLDIGIGTGRCSHILAKRGAKIYGVDISEKMVKKAKMKLGNSLKQVIITDAQKGLPFSSNFFDICISFRALKYMRNWKFVILEIKRVLKPQGIAILEFSNKESIAALGMKNANYMLFDINDVLRYIQSSNLKIIKIKGGAKLPFPLYQKINSKKIIGLFNIIEYFMRILVGWRFSRNVMIMIKVAK
jgi:ubiquinone/menaquinone biosynthesis C-methylase UbiE